MDRCQRSEWEVVLGTPDRANISVPHEVKNKRALVMRTSKIMTNGRYVITEMRSGANISVTHEAKINVH